MYFKQLIARIQRVNNQNNTLYNFSLSDKITYILNAEYPGLKRNYPLISMKGNTDGYRIIEIKNHRYYWPEDSACEPLKWMYREVFCPPIMNFHSYETKDVKIVPGDTVIDAGACEGFFSRYALERGASVIAIEPVPSLAQALKKTFHNEMIENRIQILPFALGSKSGIAHLKYTSDSLFEASISDEGDEIETTTIDDISIEKTIDFIKMDVEGYEIEAVLGAKNTIQSQKPRLAIAVYHEYANASIISNILKQCRPDYKIHYRGIYAWDNCVPRPFMVFAW
ncbi:MAG: hypothetical protein APR54_10615 [Candidatus Cloacimonas sp. SDB]|nr:MAG: hypothetical protein APR54_10615 [Candidatus Cloacimonas sp. SDB]